MTMTDEDIENHAVECAKAIWESKQFNLPYTYCTECSTRDIKQRCVCDVVDMSALCARHWILRKIEKMKAERDRQKITIRVVTPKLDVADFARL